MFFFKKNNISKSSKKVGWIKGDNVHLLIQSISTTQIELDSLSPTYSDTPLVEKKVNILLEATVIYADKNELYLQVKERKGEKGRFTFNFVKQEICFTHMKGFRIEENFFNTTLPSKQLIFNINDYSLSYVHFLVINNDFGSNLQAKLDYIISQGQIHNKILYIDAQTNDVWLAKVLTKLEEEKQHPIVINAGYKENILINRTKAISYQYYESI